MYIEQELKEVDFSSLSKVKDSLKQKLLNERLARFEISDDELDMVAAAGNPAGTFDDKTFNPNIKK